MWLHCYKYAWHTDATWIESISVDGYNLEKWFHLPHEPEHRCGWGVATTNSLRCLRAIHHRKLGLGMRHHEVAVTKFILDEHPSLVVDITVYYRLAWPRHALGRTWGVGFHICDRLWMNHPYAANIVFTVRGQICQYVLQARFRTSAVERAYSTYPTFTQSFRSRGLFIFARGKCSRSP